MLLKDQTVLITGAGSGIGKSIALLFAKEGAHVFLTGRNEERLKATRSEIMLNGGEAEYQLCDLAEDAEVTALVRKIIEKQGEIDILVNNAGISKEMPFLEMPQSVFDEIYQVNMRAVVVLTKAVLPYMVKKQKGNIINIGSGAALRGLPGSVAYSAAKAGVVCFTQALGDEMRPQGIRMNVICPGPVDTELFQKSEKREYILRAGGDVFTTETVANGALFLASDLSGEMNSQVLTMRGFNRW